MPEATKEGGEGRSSRTAEAEVARGTAQLLPRPGSGFAIPAQLDLVTVKIQRLPGVCHSLLLSGFFFFQLQFTLKILLY